MPLDDIVDESRAVCFVGDIAGDRVGTRDLLNQTGQPLGAPRGQDGDPASLANRSGELSTQPGAGTRDDDDAIF